MKICRARPQLVFTFETGFAALGALGGQQGWAKLVSILTFSKRKAMVFFEN
jgi:hypothetical protein